MAYERVIGEKVGFNERQWYEQVGPALRIPLNGATTSTFWCLSAAKIWTDLNCKSCHGGNRR